MAERMQHIPSEPVEWSDITHYQRNQFGALDNVNALHTGANSPVDPHFPKGVPMNRALYGLEEKHPNSEYSTAELVPALGTVATSGESRSGTFDHLFHVNIDEAAEAAILELKIIRSPRLDRVFTPIPTLDKMPQSKPIPLDYLWEKDENEYRRKLDAYSRARREQDGAQYDYSVVTEDTKAAASERLSVAMIADDNLRSLVQRHGHEKGTVDRSDLVDLLRKDADMRRDVGGYLYGKISGLIHKMPERIALDSEKRANHRGYDKLGKLKSREYAVLVALAMIDGTFNEDATSGDPIDRDKSGRVLLGQHRGAAQELLFSRYNG